MLSWFKKLSVPNVEWRDAKSSNVVFPNQPNKKFISQLLVDYVRSFAAQALLASDRFL